MSTPVGCRHIRMLCKAKQTIGITLNVREIGSRRGTSNLADGWPKYRMSLFRRSAKSERAGKPTSFPETLGTRLAGKPGYDFAASQWVAYVFRAKHRTIKYAVYFEQIDRSGPR